MTAAPRHKYVIVFGSCCTADAIRPQQLDDIPGGSIRLLWYQGRTSLATVTTAPLHSSEFRYDGPPESPAEWGATMAIDEALKRQQGRMRDVVNMADAIIVDTVSAFCFPYLAVPDGRRFLRSKEWDQHVTVFAPASDTWLWRLPMELSLTGLRDLFAPMFDLQPALRLVFHFPQPCFNDDVKFWHEPVLEQVDFYQRYNDQLFEAANRLFPRVHAIALRGEHADPLHYSGPFPFHYVPAYMTALRTEIEHLVA